MKSILFSWEILFFNLTPRSFWQDFLMLITFNLNNLLQFLHIGVNGYKDIMMMNIGDSSRKERHKKHLVGGRCLVYRNNKKRSPFKRTFLKSRKLHFDRGKENFPVLKSILHKKTHWIKKRKKINWKFNQEKEISHHHRLVKIKRYTKVSWKVGKERD